MFFLSDLLYSICRFITSPEMDWNVIFLQDRANYWDKWRRTSTAENSKLQARYKTVQINPGSQEVSSGLIGWIHRAIGKVNFWYLFQTSKAKKKKHWVSILSCPGGAEGRAVNIHEMLPL